MFAWIDGALTIEMATGKVGFVRYHSDPEKIPGDVEWSCAVEIDAQGEYEFKILAGKRCPTRAEIKRLTGYLETQGYSGHWHRYKNGKNSKEVKT
jgi:hypothetical protein